MDAVTVLVTGGGAPGILGTVHSLRHNPLRRPLRIITVDLRERVSGTWLADAFHTVPRPEDEEAFVSRVLEICAQEQVRVILPQVTRELEVFARARSRFAAAGVAVAVAGVESMRRANNKSLLCETASSVGCPVPRFFHVEDEQGLARALDELGYPEHRVVIKPPVSNGMRGLRILTESIDRFALWRDEKPTSVYCTRDELLAVFAGHDFPALTVSEYLPGDEFTIDLLADAGEPLVVLPRRRLEIRSGITFRGRAERHEALMEQSAALSRALGLSFAFGFQFKEDVAGTPRLLECNPRIQGTMALATFAGANVIYGALALALGEPPPPFDVQWGTELIRAWGGLAVHDDTEVGRL